MKQIIFITFCIICIAGILKYCPQSAQQRAKSLVLNPSEAFCARPLSWIFFNSQVHHCKKPKPFNDQWAKVNTAKGLHNAASDDGKLDYVLKISKRMHLPASVAVIPIIESNYRTKTYSHTGAAGIWQLMPETARDYGIKLRERYQLAASTKAALRFLNDLHRRFDNWELAYAAYNAGGQRVMNAIKKNPKALTIQELDLPAETKEYVVRLKKINALIMRFSDATHNISQLIEDFEY